jgi:hypothetical protein
VCRNLFCLIFLAFVISVVLPNSADADLIGWWKFNETAGITAADSSGNGHDGTLNGNPTWATGKLGGALRFDGVDDYVSCGLVNIDTAITGGMAVCAWINKPTGGDMKFCSNRQTAEAAGGGFTCTIYNNRLEMDFESAAGRNLNRDADGPAIPADTWVHVAWVYDDVANTFYEYHNGVLADSSTENVSVGVSTVAFRIGANSPSLDHYVNGLIDDLRVYNHAVSEAELQQAMLGWGPIRVFASNPNPINGDVPRDTVLSWTPGDFADKHNVYFGTVFDDVNTASVNNPLGVLVSPGQSQSTYNPGILDFNQTYYWRVDEVNAPPTDSTVFKGDVWSFTVEPFAYPIENITAGASSSQRADMGPGKTIDDSGLNENDEHSISPEDMWISNSAGPQPTWIKYVFDKEYTLYEMWVWNSNQSIEPSFGFGIKNVTVEYSLDDINWTQLEDVFEFERATGLPDYTHNTTVKFNGVLAKYVRITANSNWGGILPQYSLSEVRFFYLPVQARLPQPASGETDVALDAVLSWRAGRKAAVHELYFSSDREAVINGTAFIDTVSQSSYNLDSLGLELGKTYYWKVNEVNEADIPLIWEGEIWSFTIQQYLVVDDFEQYDDSCNRIYYTWQDGLSYTADPACGVAAYTGNGTGAIVGKSDAPFAEKIIVHEGGQSSMPLEYNNSSAPYYSETQRVWSSLQDWTKGGAGTLTVWFYGDVANTAGQLYVAVEDSVGKIKIVGHSQPAAIQTAGWQPFNIPLTSFAGVNLQAVKKMSIGIGDRANPQAGGSGKLYIDDIWLNLP